MKSYTLQDVVTNSVLLLLVANVVLLFIKHVFSAAGFYYVDENNIIFGKVHFYYSLFIPFFNITVSIMLIYQCSKMEKYRIKYVLLIGLVLYAFVSIFMLLWRGVLSPIFYINILLF